MSDATPIPEQPAAPPAVPETAPAPAAAGRRARGKTTLREYFESLLVTVILALFGTSFVVQAFKIPSQSMEPTLLVGDHLLVNKFIFGGRGAWYERALPYRPIQRGDLIVFRFPYDDHIHFVKRVVAIPGDRVRIVDRQLIVNHRPVSEPYKVHDPLNPEYFGDNFPPTTPGFFRRAVRDEWAGEILRHVRGGDLVVPPGRYFVLGDNRDHSFDSRFWGFVSREAIMGRPILIYWSIDATSADYADRSLPARLASLGRTLARLPSKTRWDRMFRGVR